MSRNGKQLTESQQRLLQKFPDLPPDDPLVELAAWNASLEQKVDEFGESLKIWTQAILKQTELATQQNQLIVSQNMTLQSTGQTNEALGQTLMQWKQGYEQSQQELQSLKETIAEHGSILHNWNGRSQSASNNLADLSQKVNHLSDLSQKVNTLAAQSNQANQRLSGNVQNLEANLNFSLGAFVVGIVLILLVQGMEFFMISGLSSQIANFNSSISTSVQGVRERTEWILIKLARLEKRRSGGS